MTAHLDHDAGTLTFEVGEDDTDAGVHLKVAGDTESRVHITPQGEVKTGDGTTPPTAAAGGAPDGLVIFADDLNGIGHTQVAESTTITGVDPNFYTVVGEFTEVADSGTAIGAGAHALGPAGSVAVGFGAVVYANSDNGTAVGAAAAVSGHDNAAAFGYGAAPNSDNQVALGNSDTHVSLQMGLAFHGGIVEGENEPGNPSGHQGILFVRINAGGKRQLCVRLGSGNGTSDPILVIATEA